MKTRRLRNPVALTVAMCLATACANSPDGKPVLDQKVQGALIGAAAGCALGAASGHSCGKGAVVGALAGFLISWYFESRQVASAAEVNKQYANAKSKDVPKPPKNEVVPAAFSSKVTQSPADAQGQREVQVTSSSDLIGYGDKVPDVSQKYAIYDEKNQLVEEKTEKVTAIKGAGRYETTSKFKVPPDAAGKKYTVKTELVSNGRPYKQNTYKIAFDQRGDVFLLASLH